MPNTLNREISNNDNENDHDNDTNNKGNDNDDDDDNNGRCFSSEENCNVASSALSRIVT